MKKIYNNQIGSSVRSSICIVANQKVTFGSSGNIELRKGSKKGEIIESFDISSDKVSISANEIIIQPSNQLPYETEIYLLMNDGFLISSINGSSFSGFDVDGDKEFKFTTEDPIGKFLEGGTIISKNNGTYTIVSSKKLQIPLTWYELHKAIQKVEEHTKTSEWYVPSFNELQNYKHALRPKEFYWSSAEEDSKTAYKLNINSDFPLVANKNDSYLVCLFKKVNY